MLPLTEPYPCHPATKYVVPARTVERPLELRRVPSGGKSHVQNAKRNLRFKETNTETKTDRPKKGLWRSFAYAQAKAFLYLIALVLGIAAIVIARKLWLMLSPHIP